MQIKFAHDAALDDKARFESLVNEFDIREILRMADEHKMREQRQQEEINQVYYKREEQKDYQKFQNVKAGDIAEASHLRDLALMRPAVTKE